MNFFLGNLSGSSLSRSITKKSCEKIKKNDLSKIVVLRLDHLNIDSLKRDDFNDLISLEVLDIHRNKLSNLPIGLFNNLPSLKSLRLDQNKIVRAPFGLFSNLFSVKTIYLFGNPIGKSEKNRIQAELPMAKLDFDSPGHK